MTKLTTLPGFKDPDAAFRILVEAHRGLSELESATLNACLVLILSNHIGDLEVVRAAIALAKRAVHTIEVADC